MPFSCSPCHTLVQVNPFIWWSQTLVNIFVDGTRSSNKSIYSLFLLVPKYRKYTITYIFNLCFLKNNSKQMNKKALTLEIFAWMIDYSIVCNFFLLSYGTQRSGLSPNQFLPCSFIFLFYISCLYNAVRYFFFSILDDLFTRWLLYVLYV